MQPFYMNIPPLYRVASQELTPAQVRIRGSQDRVRAINQIRTDPMDLSGVTAEKVFHTHLNIGDAQVRLVEVPADVTVRVKLEKMTNGGAH